MIWRFSSPSRAGSLASSVFGPGDGLAVNLGGSSSAARAVTASRSARAGERLRHGRISWDCREPEPFPSQYPAGGRGDSADPGSGAGCAGLAVTPGSTDRVGSGSAGGRAAPSIPLFRHGRRPERFLATQRYTLSPSHGTPGTYRSGARGSVSGNRQASQRTASNPAWACVRSGMRTCIASSSRPLVERHAAGREDPSGPLEVQLAQPVERARTPTDRRQNWQSPSYSTIAPVGPGPGLAAHRFVPPAAQRRRLGPPPPNPNPTILLADNRPVRRTERDGAPSPASGRPAAS